MSIKVLDLGVGVGTEFLTDLSDSIKGSSVESAAVYLPFGSRLDWVAKKELLPNLVVVQQICSETGLTDFDIADPVRLVWSSLGSSSLMRRVMELGVFYGFRVSFLPRDESLVGPGGMHESQLGYESGLGYDPELSETTEVARLLEIARYTKAKIHLSKISCSRSCALIESAKKSGVDVTADTTMVHLLYSEADVTVEKTELKMLPPLRNVEDRNKLIEAVEKSVIDVVCTGHTVLASGDKLRNFYDSKSGRNALSSLDEDIVKLGGLLSKERLVSAVSLKPNELLFG